MTDDAKWESDPDEGAARYGGEKRFDDVVGPDGVSDPSTWSDVDDVYARYEREAAAEKLARSIVASARGEQQ